MNQSDRDTLDKQSDEIAGLRLSCDENTRNTGIVYEIVKAIRDNCLVHLKNDIRWLKWAVGLVVMLAVAERLF